MVLVLCYPGGRIQGLRKDEEYRFSNGTGGRSKKQSDCAVPGPQGGHRLARGTGCGSEPAYFRVDGALQDARKRSPLAQRSAADGGAAPPVVGLFAQPKSGT